MYSPRQGFTKADLEEFATAIAAALVKQHLQGLDPVEHREQHEALAAWIEAQKARRQLFQKITAHVFGWAVIAVVTGIGYSVWHYFKMLLAR